MHQSSGWNVQMLHDPVLLDRNQILRSFLGMGREFRTSSNEVEGVVPALRDRVT